METGSQIFLVTENGDIPMPVGEFPLMDGTIIVVLEEGIIAEINAPEEEVVEEPVEDETEMEKPTEEKPAEEMEDKPAEEVNTDPTDTPDPITELEKRVAAIEELIAKLNENDFSKFIKIDELENYIKKEDLEKTKDEFNSKFEQVPGAEPVIQNEKPKGYEHKTLGSWDDIKNKEQNKKMLGSYEDMRKNK
jgi:hypothetical protein